MTISTYQSLGGNTAAYTVPTMPEIPAGQEPWAGSPEAFWTRKVTGAAVDAARTRLLAHVDVDCPVEGAGGNPPHDGSSYGMPFHLLDTAKARKVPVLDLSRPPEYRWVWAWPPLQIIQPIDRIPLPDKVLTREGDPGNAFDKHAYVVDPTNRVLIEMYHMLPDARLGAEWTSSHAGGGRGACQWNTGIPWNALGQPYGVVAACVPQFPMIARFEELLRGAIAHALVASLPDYAPRSDGLAGPARGSDGSWKGHPCRAGERLRLTDAALAQFTPGTVAYLLAKALNEYGLVIVDRNRHGVKPSEGSCRFTLTLDRRFHEGTDMLVGLKTVPFAADLSDFEVIDDKAFALAA